jgi:hypothetical protein
MYIGRRIYSSKVHQRSLNLLWCVIPVPKLAKRSSRSSNLLIVSYVSQIYLNNLLNLLSLRDTCSNVTEPDPSAAAIGTTQPLHVGGLRSFVPTGGAHEVIPNAGHIRRAIDDIVAHGEHRMPRAGRSPCTTMPPYPSQRRPKSRSRRGRYRVLAASAHQPGRCGAASTRLQGRGGAAPNR